jgi:hypothetical protein
MFSLCLLHLCDAPRFFLFVYCCSFWRCISQSSVTPTGVSIEQQVVSFRKHLHRVAKHICLFPLFLLPSPSPSPQNRARDECGVEDVLIVNVGGEVCSPALSFRCVTILKKKKLTPTDALTKHAITLIYANTNTYAYTYTVIHNNLYSCAKQNIKKETGEISGSTRAAK